MAIEPADTIKTEQNSSNKRRVLESSVLINAGGVYPRRFIRSFTVNQFLPGILKLKCRRNRQRVWIN